MIFKIVTSSREIFCTKSSLLRTAELQLGASEADVIPLISFMATALEGSSIDLNFGRLERLEDDEERYRNVVFSRPPYTPPKDSSE